jgi:hypothetical protein
MPNKSACRRWRQWVYIDEGTCDLLTQGLIGLIEYSYHQGIPSFRMGDRPESFPGCARVRTNVRRKD